MLWCSHQALFCNRNRGCNRKPLSGLTVEAEADQSEVFGKLVSELQSDVAITSTGVTGTLAYVTDYTGFSSDPELQSGNFIALKISDVDSKAVSVKGGIVPSAIGMDLVEMINDPDQNIVLRVTDKGVQKATFVQKDADGNELKQEFALSGLTLEPAPEVDTPAG